MKTTKMYFGIILFLLSLGLRAQYVVDFEGTGETDGGYAAATVSLNGINWSIGPQALIGTSPSDIKNGARSARIRRHGSVFGSISMTQDKQNGIGTITFLYSRSNFSGDRATTGDGPPSFIVEYSMNGGSTWTQAGSTISLDGVNSLTTFSATVDEPGNGRIRIVQTAGAAGRRWNVDDISITDFGGSGPSVSIPQAFSASLSSASSVSFSATANSENDNVILVTNNTSTFGTPADGTAYSVSSTIPGGGTVLFVGSASSIPNHTGLNPEETFYYRLWSVDNANNYSAAALSANATTPSSVRPIPYLNDFTINPFNDGWLNISLVGTQTWNHGTGEVWTNAFAGGCQDNDNWFISPPFDLTAQSNELLSITTAEQFSGSDLEVLYSTDYNGFGDPTTATWTAITTFTTGNAGSQSNLTNLQSVNNNSVYIAFRYQFVSGGCSRWAVTDFNIITAASPFVTTTGTPLSSFSTDEGDFSPEQDFKIEGDNLSGDLTVTAPAEFEVSLSSGSGFGSSVTVNVTGSTLAPTDIFVRMTGATAGTFSGNVQISGGGLATTVNVPVSGNVILPPPPPAANPAAAFSGLYQENFSGFDSEPNLPFGWLVDADGSAGNKLDFSPWANGGNNTTGVKHSTNNANVLGYQHTGTTGVATFSLTLENTTGSTIDSLAVSYLGKVARSGEGRSPEFSVSFNGSPVAGLSYSTLNATDDSLFVWITGLNIQNTDTFQIVWSSERGAGGGSSRQIGISNVLVSIPSQLPSGPVAPTAPVVNVTGTPLSSFSTTEGTESAEQSFSITGNNLTGNIDISAPTGFEVSLSATTGYTNLISVTPVSGEITATDIFVRLSGSSVGSFSGDVEISGGGLSAPIEITVSGNVTAPPTPDPDPELTGFGVANAYSINFSNFVSDVTLPNGWTVDASGSANNRLDFSPWFAGGNTSTGVKYSTSQANVLGYQHTGSTGIASFTLSLENQTGFPIQELEVSYLGKVSRTTEGRSPEFEVLVAGNPVSGLAYSTAGDTNALIATTISGLNILNGQTFEIVWNSQLGSGSGANKQIGISNVQIFVPEPGVFAPVGINLSLVDRDIISFDVTPNLSNDNVLIVTNNTNTFGVPADGVSYSIGDPLPGGGTVYYVGPASGVPNHTGRSEGTEYFYRAWSFDGSNDYSNNFVSASIRTPNSTVAIPYTTNFSTNPLTDNVWIERDLLGSQSWVYNTGFGGRMEISGQASSVCNDNDDWLISPAFDLSVNNNVIVEAAVSERFGGNNLLMFYSDDYDGFGDPNDFSWTLMETITSSATSSTPVAHPIFNTDLQSVSQNRVYIAFRYQTLSSPACSEWRVEDFSVILTTTPTLVATATPTPFSTVVGVPSAEQTILVSGDDLQDDILVSAPTGYEVSLTSGSGFGSSVSIPFGSGTVAATDVFVRLTGAAQGTFNGNIEVTTPQAITQTIALEGQVSAAPPAITATGAAGAYFENFQDFVSAATLPDGWAVDASGSAGNRLDYSPWANGGNTNTGFKFSTANANVLGYQHTANTGIATFSLTILNQSGSTINALQVSYRGKVERTNQTRNPEFEVKIDGVSYPALAYSTADGVDSNITAIVSGLSIADNQTFEISWVSDRGTPAGTSRQIGISNVEVMIPQPATVTIEDLGNQILAGNVLQGATNHVLHQTEVVAVQNPALVTSVSFELDGTYDVADIANLKLRYSTNATLDPSDPTLG
ncbi:MAG: hypothetical protein EA358_03770, partial [Flavobacteriales bacterium]